MAHPSKTKGDAAEREAFAVLETLAAGLLVADAGRLFGAGRRDDRGDLHVFSDVAVQVKSSAQVATAIREAADGAAAQAGRSCKPSGLGLVPIPHARRKPVADAVRWLACTLRWPDEPDEDHPVFGQSSAAVGWARGKSAGSNAVPVGLRVACVRRMGVLPVWVGPVQAWLASYRFHHGQVPVAAGRSSGVG